MNIELVIEILLTPINIKKPWMTSKGILKRLGSDISEITSAVNLEKLLLQYVQNDHNPLIRYSSLPSKNSLEVLWGHASHVGRINTMSIYKIDEASEFSTEPDKKGNVDVFFSHSHKDFNHVMEISKTLLTQGIVPWLAETHIRKGEHINLNIIDALKKRNQFLLFLSHNSLNSKWTGKETRDAMRTQKAFLIIADCSDISIKKVITEWANGNNNSSEDFQGNASRFFSDLFRDTELNKLVFIYPFGEKLNIKNNTNNRRIYSIDKLSEIILSIQD